MQHTGGRWIVGIVGAVIVVCGAVLVWEGLAHKFEKYFELDQMTARQRKIVEFSASSARSPEAWCSRLAACSSSSLRSTSTRTRRAVSIRRCANCSA